MKATEITALFQSFEQIALEIADHFAGIGKMVRLGTDVESWSAKWERFKDALERTNDSCTNACESVADHFADVRKMVSIDSSAEHQVDDFMLTRYAC